MIYVCTLFPPSFASSFYFSGSICYTYEVGKKLCNHKNIFKKKRETEKAKMSLWFVLGCDLYPHALIGIFVWNCLCLKAQFGALELEICL